MSEYELLRVMKAGDDALAVTALKLFLSSFFEQENETRMRIAH